MEAFLNDERRVSSCQMFVVVRQGGGDFSRVSPFLIDKAIKREIGGYKAIKLLKNKNILIETASCDQSKRLLQMTSLSNDIKVSVSPHRSLNFCKGTINCPEITGLREDEIAENLKDQNVVCVRRLNRKVRGETILTNSYLLTFVGRELPEKIRVGYLYLNVRLFIPSPLRCYRCFGFQHQAKACKKTPICFLCGKEKHGDLQCTHSITCVNCSGNHPSISAKCPIWEQEKCILEIMAKNKISYNHAKQSISKNTANKSYANVASVAPNHTVIITNEENKISNLGNNEIAVKNKITNNSKSSPAQEVTSMKLPPSLPNNPPQGSKKRNKNNPIETKSTCNKPSAENLSTVCSTSITTSSLAQDSPSMKLPSSFPNNLPNNPLQGSKKRNKNNPTEIKSTCNKPNAENSSTACSTPLTLKDDRSISSRQNEPEIENLTNAKDTNSNTSLIIDGKSTFREKLAVRTRSENRKGPTDENKAKGKK